MKIIGYAILAVAAGVSLVFVKVLMPSTIRVALFTAAWMLAPYAALALGLFLSKQRAWVIAHVVVAGLAAVGGSLFLTFVIFVRPDPQGGIAVMATPIFQAIGIGVLLPACYFLFRARA